MQAKMSINRLALGSIRAGKKRYVSLALGIVLAVFFVSSLLLLAQSVYASFQNRYQRLYGKQDMIIRDAAIIAPQRLKELGIANHVGIAHVFAQSVEGGVSIGSYDAMGEALRYRRLLSGRLPEKAGEIAIDQGAMQKMRLKLALGDSFELELRTPSANGLLPEPHTRRFTLVGITQDQLLLPQGMSEWADYWLDLPGATTVFGETAMPGGREVVHYLVDNPRGLSPEKASKLLQQEGLGGWPLAYGFKLFDYDSGNFAAFLLLLAIILSTALILTASMAIINALNANLAQRSRQIGMLRAVGATSGQIRSIFGREALLIALLTAPLGIGLSYLAVSLPIGLIGEPLKLYHVWWFLPVALVASILVVMLAAALPLRRASLASPMQAIRDTSLLRQKRKLRIQPMMAFEPARLLAKRHLQLYRSRRLGVSVMVAASMVIITLAYLGFTFGGLSTRHDYDYSITRDHYQSYDLVDFSLVEQRLNAADILEATQLPYVKDSFTAQPMRINLHVDAISRYMAAGMRGVGTWYARPSNDPLWVEHAQKEQERYRGVLDQLQVAGDLMSVTLVALDDASILALKDQVTSGQIDLAALDSGQAVIVTAPQNYYKVDAPKDSNTDFWYQYALPHQEGGKVLETIPNDSFAVGDELSLIHLAGTSAHHRDMATYSKDKAASSKCTDLKLRTTAIINPPANVRPYFSGYDGLFDTGSLLTTQAGLIAMGFGDLGYSSLSLRLGSQPDDTTKEFLHNNLQDIASRGDGLVLRDYQRMAQDERRWMTVLWVAVISLVLIFFVLCFSMVNNALTLRLKADRSAIGTLRAVGADMGLIVASYRQQLYGMLRLGAIAGLLLSAAALAYFLPNVNRPGFRFPVLLALLLGFLLMLVLLCSWSLRLSMGRVTRRSIVDNIREL